MEVITNINGKKISADLIALKENDKATSLTDKLAAIDSNISNLNSKYYGLNTSITPENDCYAEVVVNARGWGYGGKDTYLSIVKNGNPTTITECLGYTSGHDNTADNVTSFGVYKLTAGKTYSFNCGDFNPNGSTSNKCGYVKVTL